MGLGGLGGVGWVYVMINMDVHRQQKDSDADPANPMQLLIQVTLKLRNGEDVHITCARWLQSSSK